MDYTATASDVEMALEDRTVILVEKKSSSEWIWKVLGVLLIMVLCLGGVMLFAWYWNGSDMTVRRSSGSEFDVKSFSNVCAPLISLFLPLQSRPSRAKQKL